MGGRKNPAGHGEQGGWGGATIKVCIKYICHLNLRHLCRVKHAWSHALRTRAAAAKHESSRALRMSTMGRPAQAPSNQLRAACDRPRPWWGEYRPSRNAGCSPSPSRPSPGAGSMAVARALRARARAAAFPPAPSRRSPLHAAPGAAAAIGPPRRRLRAQHFAAAARARRTAPAAVWARRVGASATAVVTAGRGRTRDILARLSHLAAFQAA